MLIEKDIFLNNNSLDCDDLSSLEVGNETKWGCEAASNNVTCLHDSSWHARCCIWNNTECKSKYQGTYLHFACKINASHVKY